MGKMLAHNGVLEAKKKFNFRNMIKIQAVLFLFYFIAGSYKHKGALDTYYQKNGKGFTMQAPLNKIGSGYIVPGSGSYNLNFSDKRKNPTYKIGTS